MKIKKTSSLSRRAGLLTSAIVATALFVSISTPAAAADPFWPEKLKICNSGYATLTMTVTGGDVRVGWDALPNKAKGTIKPWVFKKGTHTMYSGLTRMWWMKWTSPGHVESWHTNCVPYA